MFKENKLSPFFMVIVYSVCFFSIQFFLNKIGFLPNAPDEQNIALWDVGWYRNIATNGYVHTDGSSNTGFFILFPLIWKISHLSVWGISILNILFFAIAFTILVNLYPVTTADKLVWLSIPSLYFIFIPYTEALFFLLMSLCFYGMVHKKKWLIWFSLFLVSLTRATTVFLIPSFLVMELVTNQRAHWLKAIKTYFLTYAWPLIAGLYLFIWYQYKVTGIWFEYFQQQANGWGHKFSMPAFPFNSVAGDKTIWVSALAMFVALIALFFILRIFIKWLAKNIISEDKLLVLSLCYLPIILMLTVFFNPIWGSNTTNLMGMHRYTFATPFFFVFFHYLTQNRPAYKVKDYLVVLLLSNVVWLSMGSYKHIQYLLFFNFNTLIIYLYMLYANKKLNWVVPAIFALNIILQIFLFQQFIGNLYPD